MLQKPCLSLGINPGPLWGVVWPQILLETRWNINKHRNKYMWHHERSYRQALHLKLQMRLSDIPPLWKYSLSWELPMLWGRQTSSVLLNALPYISERMRIDITEKGHGARPKSHKHDQHKFCLLITFSNSVFLQ